MSEQLGHSQGLSQLVRTLRKSLCQCLCMIMLLMRPRESTALQRQLIGPCLAAKHHSAAFVIFLATGGLRGAGGPTL